MVEELPDRRWELQGTLKDGDRTGDTGADSRIARARQHNENQGAESRAEKEK